jgi:hypothetical protein
MPSSFGNGSKPIRSRRVQDQDRGRHLRVAVRPAEGLIEFVAGREILRGHSMAEKVLIRLAVTSDIPDLCRIAERLALQHAAYDPARYRLPMSVADAYADLLTEQLGRKDALVLVAEASGVLVGYAFARVEPPSEASWNGTAAPRPRATYWPPTCCRKSTTTRCCWPTPSRAAPSWTTPSS